MMIETLVHDDSLVPRLQSPRTARPAIARCRQSCLDALTVSSEAQAAALARLRRARSGRLTHTFDLRLGSVSAFVDVTLRV